MKATGIKFICELENGEINTLNCDFDRPVSKIIENYKILKDWVGGKFIEIYIEFENDGNYQKVQLDIKRNKYNQLLDGKF